MQQSTDTSRYNGKCAHCGMEFIINKASKRFCSDRCRMAAWKAKTTKFVSPDGKMIITVRCK